MSVQTSITKPDGTLQSVRWGWWHLARLHDAMVDELERTSVFRDRADVNMDDEVKWFPSEFVFIFDHTFVDEEDGEVFTIEAESVYRTWR